ncbi:hypothetical protein C1H46_024693 [Malus baccata]|uniref:Reverse transcriptase zinc-binding domain-containing protein n=1 Tax=Malus baccata TaxID=106549 RepID=A0A540LTR6_MALBA|nr:hypothetical protein C1H46_024693 [Malus baccata]
MWYLALEIRRTMLLRFLRKQSCWRSGSRDSGSSVSSIVVMLFLLSRKHNQNISSFVEASASPLCWNFDFRRNLNEMEIVEVATLLQKLEEVRLSPIKRDIRRWNLEVSGLFSCKSYRSLRSNDGIVHYFPPYPQIWKSKVPPKVKILVWLVANGNLNTCDRIQRRNPLMCLSPHWCSLCKAKEESVNHIFLHCSYSIQLWWKLFQEVKASWVIPKGCFELLSTNFKALGKRKKSKVLWGCLVLAIFWNIWMERNKRIFEDYTGVGAEELWGRVKYWAAFWASVTKEFNNVSLSQILWDLLAAVK